MRVEYVIAAPNRDNLVKALNQQKLLIFWVWPTWVRVDNDTYWPVESYDGGWRCREMNIDKADLAGINSYYTLCKLEPPVRIIGQLNEQKEIEVVLCEDCTPIPENLTLDEWIAGVGEVVGPFSEFVAHAKTINLPT